MSMWLGVFFAFLWVQIEKKFMALTSWLNFYLLIFYYYITNQKYFLNK